MLSTILYLHSKVAIIPLPREAEGWPAGKEVEVFNSVCMSVQ